MRLVVNGETFEVEERRDRPGQYNCTWLTGPHLGYGFTCSFSRSRPVGADPAAGDLQADLENAIAGFLGDVDPETGYIPD